MNFKEQTGEYERLIWQLDDRYGCVDPERRKRQRGITHHFYNQTSWILGYAQTVQKEPLLWKFSVQSNPTSFVQVVDRERIPWSKFTGDPAPLIHSSDGAIYRSIKHQLYKRFVRAHKACLARLLKLKYDESRCIDGNSVCPIALAYLTWRMSIERLGNLEGLTVRRKNTYSIKFMSPSQNASLRFRQIWSHLSFNALVSFYQHSCGIRKIAVDFDAERPCNGYVISHPSKGKNQTEEKFFILHPQVLPNMSLVECKLVRAKRDLLVSQTMNRFSYWAWGLNSEPSNTVIQVQLPSDSSSSTNQHYSYIQI
ncbi:hypothetical protein RGU72_06260 [Undibacterium sp. 5I1]|uniref:hypothetical protein n=1 Tax=unclassified Undibacterium TaxID=2630295 RepID=UPI002AB4D4BF|nr:MULTISPECIES: hypothetical protein [unclassified Undibacterium]MDY7537858.1 hypothetical protein [Undibacterium sp. 5I1]MEB0232314.1 hypothetical protein [Undibacterium sp. 10I3]MEB0259117.1 hypothetical protein [Undibacterium sp. 5I1]